MVACRTRGFRKFRRRQFEIAPHIVAEGGHKDRGEILSRLGDGSVQARHIVIFEVQEVRAILARYACDAGRTPWQCPVIGVARNKHLAPPGAGPGDRHASRGRIAAVLLEHRPIGMRHHGHEILRKIHHDLTGAVEAVAQHGLRTGRRLNFGMPVAEQNRPPAAHEIDIFAPVDVAHTASLRRGEKLRIAFGQPRRVQMTPHPAGNDPAGPRPQHRVRCLRLAQHRRLLGHGLPFVDLRIQAAIAYLLAGAMSARCIFLGCCSWTSPTNRGKGQR